MKKYLFLVCFFLLITSLAVPSFSVSAATFGNLIKGSTSAVYYVTAAGTRMAFPNESTYFSWYKDFSLVQTVSDAEISKLQLAGLITLRPGISPVKIQTDNNYYAVAHGGVLRRLESSSIASIIFGADWLNKITVIPDAFLTSYKMGAIINSTGQYWWKVEQNNSPDISRDLVAIQTSNETNLADQKLTNFFSVTKTTSFKKINLLTGLWNPHDPGTKITPSKETITQVLFGNNSSDKSVSGYFKEMSGGSVEMANAGVFGWYDSIKPYTHYWDTPDPTDADGDGYVNGHNEKWAETILRMDKEIDFSTYDTNHNSVLEPEELGVLIVIPTDGPFGTNRVVMSREFPSAEPMVVDGVQIGMIAEWYTGNPPNFGVVAHELSHLFFNTTDMYLDSLYRAGSLSLMDGSYCNCYLDPWHRLAGGKNWLNVLTPNGNGNYELPDINTSHSVLKIPRPGSEEFLLIEYRKHDQYNDVGAPGLLIWDIKNSSTNGDWGRDNIHLLRANGGTPLDDGKASYFGTTGSDADTGVIKWFDGVSSGISISNIGVPGATIKFKLNLTP